MSCWQRIASSPARFWRWLVVAWQWAGKNKEQLTILFAAIAGIYVLIEYRRNETDAKIKRTMEFQARYAQSEILAARLRLETFWLDPDSKKHLAAAPGTAPEKITQVVLDHKLAGNVFLLADFMGQLTTCLKNDLCDLATACSAFRNHVVAVRNTYFDLFTRWEKDWGENLIKEQHQYFTTKCPK
jgi:hypothetical protein